jgi:hypothetical protein
MNITLRCFLALERGSGLSTDSARLTFYIGWNEKYRLTYCMCCVLGWMEWLRSKKVVCAALASCQTRPICGWRELALEEMDGSLGVHITDPISHPPVCQSNKPSVTLHLIADLTCVPTAHPSPPPLLYLPPSIPITQPSPGQRFWNGSLTRPWIHSKWPCSLFSPLVLIRALWALFKSSALHRKQGAILDTSHVCISQEIQEHR